MRDIKNADEDCNTNSIAVKCIAVDRQHSTANHPNLNDRHASKSPSVKITVVGTAMTRDDVEDNIKEDESNSMPTSMPKSSTSSDELSSGMASLRLQSLNDTVSVDEPEVLVSHGPPGGRPTYWDGDACSSSTQFVWPKLDPSDVANGGSKRKTAVQTIQLIPASVNNGATIQIEDNDDLRQGIKFQRSVWNIQPENNELSVSIDDFDNNVDIDRLFDLESAKVDVAGLPLNADSAWKHNDAPLFDFWQLSDDDFIEILDNSTPSEYVPEMKLEILSPTPSQQIIPSMVEWHTDDDVKPLLPESVSRASETDESRSSESHATVHSPADSGFIDGNVVTWSPGSSPERCTTVPDLPAEDIFNYVETKLREMNENKSSTMQRKSGHVPTNDVIHAQPNEVPLSSQSRHSRNEMAKACRYIAQFTKYQLTGTDSNGDTMLHKAIRIGEYLAEALIYRLTREQLTSQLINQRNQITSETPLWLATRSNRRRIVNLLVKSGATVSAQVYERSRQSQERGGPFCSAIHHAASGGLQYVETLAELLQSSNVDLSDVDSQGRTALHRAIEVHGLVVSETGNTVSQTEVPKHRIDSLETVRLLILHGADINQPDLVHHKTSMMWAIEQTATAGSVELVRRLLDATSSGHRQNAKAVKTRLTNKRRSDNPDQLLCAVDSLLLAEYLAPLRSQLNQLLIQHFKQFRP